MMSLEVKLKEAMVKRLLLSEVRKKEKYIVFKDKSYTREDVASEIQNETEIGIELMVLALNLSLVQLNKENQGECHSLFPWEPWALYEAVQKDGRVFQFDTKPIYSTGFWSAPANATTRLKEVGICYMPKNTLIKRYDTGTRKQDL